jgi:hypothetical protein
MDTAGLGVPALEIRDFYNFNACNRSGFSFSVTCSSAAPVFSTLLVGVIILQHKFHLMILLVLYALCNTLIFQLFQLVVSVYILFRSPITVQLLLGCSKVTPVDYGPLIYYGNFKTTAKFLQLS